MPFQAEMYDWMREIYADLSLNLAGLIVLADMDAAAKRTALTGTSSILDSLVLVPGLHKQATAPGLSKGEYPACAAMTTGYVFRVENPATVYYLQNVGKPGHLTTLTVSSAPPWPPVDLSMTAYYGAVSLTLAPLRRLLEFDPWACSAVVVSMLVRFINFVVIQQRAKPGWFGASEPDIHSSLLVLLSQDRWVRIEGPTDDVKAVTSGTWLRQSTPVESVLETVATLLVYLSIMLVASATKPGQIWFLCLMVGSLALLSLSNATAKFFQMHGRTLQITAGPKKYDRRLTLAKELIKEFKRTDCFVGMGMIQPHQAEEAKRSYNGAVVM